MRQHEDDPGYLFDDDLEQIARRSMDFAKGQGARDLEPWTSPFARLAKGKTLGKKTVINVGVTGGFPNPPVITSQVMDMLEVRGEDVDAMQLGLTLCPPLVLPTTGLVLPANVSDINGEMSSEQILALGAAFFFGRCEAIIEWGIGGLSCQMNADFQNGLVVNLQASWLRVKGVFRNDLPEVVTPAAYAVGIFVGPASAAPSRAQLTQEIGTVAIGSIAPVASAIRAIPRFAREIQIHTDAFLTTTDFVLQFFQSPLGGAVISTVRFTGTAGTSPFFPPINSKTMIPGNAYYYRIVNSSPTELRFKAIFDLAI